MIHHHAAFAAPPVGEARPRICVVGVGGAGCNAIDHMIRRGVDGVDFLAINTDAPKKGASVARDCILLAPAMTQDDPDITGRLAIGRNAARQVLPQIRRALAGARMCFIAVGMGGRTGTGAAPEIARAARALGILTVAVVIKPFWFEGGRRQRLAEAGIAELRRTADALIVIPNQKLLETSDPCTTVSAAFQAADEILEQGVRSIVDLIVRPGIVDVDFADVRAVMHGMGKAVLGTGEASGVRRALDAADRAVSNPLLDGALDGARKLLISIVGGDDLRLAEIDAAAKSITQRVHPDAQIIWGSAHDARLGSRIRVSVIATGIEAGPPLTRSALPLACRLGGHAPGAGVAFNRGVHFGTCRNCGNDLIRSGRSWQCVPGGMRVVWRGVSQARAPAIKASGPVRGHYRRPARPRWWNMATMGFQLLAFRAVQSIDEIDWRHRPRWQAAARRRPSIG